jgi:signal transduction histidine kinase/CheY-like chemotaxis protein
MKAFKIFKRLWNGGLNAAFADPSELARRRTVAVVGFILVPCAILLVISHFIILNANNHRAAIIFATMVVGLFSLYVQAYKNWQRVAAYSIIGALWLAPVSLMIQEGFSSSNWAWLLPVILLANFILSRRASIAFTIVSVFVLALVCALTTEGLVGSDIDAAEHAVTVAISGSLILVLACLLGYSYRTSQIKSQSRLKRSMGILANEADTRRAAELKALAGERAKATFLTTVSHELRTPLNGVIGASDLLIARDLDVETRELVNIVKNSGEILLDVINNVLDLSRLDEGKLELVNQSVNLGKVIESCIDPLQVLSQAKGLTLLVDMDESVSRNYMLDPSRIRQLVLNICGNAIKFTNQGTVVISVTEEGSRVKLAIQDTGIGIAEDKLQEIFDPFAQVDSSVDRQFQGSGLGLSIVDRLVRLLGGEIIVESEVGVGTCFSILLPLEHGSVKEDVGTGDSFVPASCFDISPATVLVTDDNIINRKVASQLLKKLGHQVIEATDGLEAITAIQNEEIDIVLMDVQMPNMDGLTATSKIRGMKFPLCEIPVIGVTANALPGAESEILESGMDNYLAKPVRLDQLKQTLYMTMTMPKKHD